MCSLKPNGACPDLGLTTVYRTLEILEQMGVIRRVHLDDGCEGFAPASAEHGHHLICSRCQETIEFEDCNLNALLKRVSEQTGFTIQQHWLELVGSVPEMPAEEVNRQNKQERIGGRTDSLTARISGTLRLARSL